MGESQRNRLARESARGAAMQRVGIGILGGIGRLATQQSEKALLGEVGIVGQDLGESLPAHQRCLGAP